jgi:hypothetical protein
MCIGKKSSSILSKDAALWNKRFSLMFKMGNGETIECSLRTLLGLFMYGINSVEV